MMKHWTRAAAPLLALFLLAGCQPPSGGLTAEDVEELKAQQAEILKEVKALKEEQTKLLAGARPRPQRPAEDYNKVYDIKVEGAATKGNPNAKVAIVEYSDFQCPFCAKVQPQLEALLEKYPNDVKLVYKHFPLSFHQQARPAAIAAMAAQEQGKFWEMHDVLFDNQRSLSEDKLEEYARTAGLDVARFKQDMETKAEEYNRRVTADMQEGSRVDVRGTPALYIGGKKVRVRTVEGMSAMIEAALKAAEG